MNQDEMDQALQACIRNFGTAPRRVSWRDKRGYLKFKKPDWLKQSPDDRMNVLFQNLGPLWKKGIITWGKVIQANGQLFSPGPDNHPGELLYTLDDPHTVDVQDLIDTASQLFALKGTQPTDPSLLSIADYLTDELIRVFGQEVPYSICPTTRCRISTAFFVRQHLPDGVLSQGLMPILVIPYAPNVVTVLPERYWPDDLKQWWVS